MKLAHYSASWCLILGMSLWGAQAEELRPLLMPGKQSLYQRVLASPGSRLYSQPGDTTQPQPVIPFTAYYVYERYKEADEEWIQVGSDAHGTVLGWIAQRQLIPWNQALTVSFKDPKDVGRVLLFRDHDSLKRLLDKYDLETYGRLYSQAVKGETSKDSPVLAIQPSAHIDIYQNFYLVPIKQHEGVYLSSEKGRMLQIASVPLSAAADPGLGQKSQEGWSKARRSYRSGIVFVVDTTQSMRPYIDRTREVVRKVYGAIDTAGLREKVSFGLTGFRDYVGAEPALEYLTRSFVTLQEGTDPEKFFRNVEAAAAAEVTNQDFREDAFAGVKSAIENNDWSDFDARYIIVVTDASARLGGDPLSGTKLDTQDLRRLAHDKGIAIWVLHLRTPMGRSDHRVAEKQYKELSEYPGIGDFYYGVELGRPEEFGRVLELLARQLTQQVQATVTGTAPVPIREPQSSPDSLTRLQQKVAKLGYALQMNYLQRTKGEQPPAVFDAWIVDRDFRDPRKAAIDVRVLLTRDQLSDLRNSLQQVLDLAEEGVLSPHNFFSELKRMAASLSRDPGKLGASPAGEGTTLGELGYMREYMEDLPYVSEVLSISLRDWEDWSAKQQLDFIHRLESKVNYYQAVHDHTDLWVSLGGGPVSGDSVFPIPLEMLP